MKTLPEVDAAKALMTEAVDWSVLKWLREKKRVRKAADDANARLDALNARLKSEWPAEVRRAYEQLTKGVSGSVGGEVQSYVKKMKHADDQAKAARDDAENTFDEAERQLSTSMAREGCKKAILSWELHERAIQLCESGIPAPKVKV